MKPILYSSPGSPSSRRVVMLIRELGLENDIDVRTMDVRPRGMGGDNDKPDFLQINPNGKVPVLRDGDLTLWESHAISWYLADQHGNTPLWPHDTRARAEIAMWQLWQVAQLSPAVDALMYLAFTKSTDTARIAELGGQLQRWLGVLDNALADREWLVTGTCTCADFAVATALMYCDKAQLAERANARAWLARVEARPAWVETSPRAPR
jgi:glutathione S-transferase